jgi:cytochrome c oxidase subunit I
MASDATVVAGNGSEPSYLEYAGKGRGLKSWILSTDHKRIGILYFISLLIFYTAGVTFGFLMRLELISPGRTIMDAQTYNQIFTLHGVIMIFLFVIPGIPAVFGNFFLPILIGAKDVAFPRINLLSWYLFAI